LGHLMRIVRGFPLRRKHTSEPKSSANHLDMAWEALLHSDLMQLYLILPGKVDGYLERLASSPRSIIRDKNSVEQQGNSMIQTHLRHTSPPVSAKLHSPLGPAYREKLDRH
jgi:hypothetical protein